MTKMISQNKSLRAAGGFCALVAATSFVSTTFAQGDPDVVEKIIDEGKYSSQVWDHLTYLSEEIGPRLTGSTNLDRAHAWTRDKFIEFGLTATNEKWGEVPVRFDRGPSYAKMTSPANVEFEMTTRSWAPGTNGPVTGPVFKNPTTLEELAAIEDKLEGAWILSKPQARRGRRRGGGGGGEETDEARAAREVQEQITSALDEAGIAGRIVSSRNDIVLTGAVRGWRELEYDQLGDEVNMTVRRIDYDAMNSRLSDGEEVTVEANLVHHFAEGPFPLFNTIAEIKGTEWPDEVVIVSGHLDSWDGPGTQATQDNGTGCSTALEAARLLMAAGAQPKRTIRFILWSAEEQGLHGSTAYVKNLSEEEKAGISAAFVEDGGTNYSGGVSCIASMEPMLARAIAPIQEAFPDLPMKLDVRERMSRFGGSDHAPFVRAGIPGFFFMETGSGGREGKNYNFIHHTQHDTMRYAVPEYLVQSATLSAVLAYNLACADTLLPRELEETEAAAPATPTLSANDPNFKAVDSKLTGVWTVQLFGDDGPMDMKMSFNLLTNAKNQISGVSDSEYSGPRNISKGSFDAETGKISFITVSEDGGEVNYTATLKDGVMKGKLSVPDTFSFDFTAKKAASAKSAAGN